MKSHKYWSIDALVSMIGTCYTGYKNMKSAHKYCAFSSLICMAMAIYSGHKMISGKFLHHPVDPLPLLHLPGSLHLLDFF